ncbi:hypothetical protein CkaCkLH20_09783 [Colletotrichum karsti]|uniref:Uncharacterized protein n=1 Tax=Colletotrichum karsti TaxID=1095194 RepID=A0A9P6HY75_9PEZI|nr:uncharacterized protein CkaCkLH20_09783 [Colletotrichum karsti]KAF9872604.1 hypothetical protein CkaCkLH20_09783 [Colletotrichum karsti]
MGDTNRYFFRGESVRSGLSVVDVDLDRKCPRRSSLVLSGTTPAGVFIGSIYAILAPAFDLSQPVTKSKVLAWVQITGRAGLESQAKFVQVGQIKEKAWDEIRAGCVAFLQKLPTDRKVLVDIAKAVEEEVPDFRKQWDSHRGNNLWLQLADQGPDQRLAKFTIQANSLSKTFEIKDHDGEFAQEFYNNLKPISLDSTKSITLLIRRLDHIARFRFMRDMKSSVPSLDHQISVTMVSDPNEADAEPSAGAQKAGIPGGPYPVVHEQDVFLVVRNNSASHMGFSLIDFCSEFGIKQVWPCGQGFKGIGPRERLVITTTLGIPTHLLNYAKAQGGVMETLKLFAVRPSTSLHMLEIPTLEALESPPEFRGEHENTDLTPTELYELLGQSDIPLRGATCYEVVEHWQAINVSFCIKPSSMEGEDEMSDSQLSEEALNLCSDD